MYAVDVEPGCSQWFWITLKTDPARSKPGKYAGQVTIKADQGQATLPIEVEVLPFDLVALDRAALHYGGCHPALLAGPRDAGTARAQSQHHEHLGRSGGSAASSSKTAR